MRPPKDLAKYSSVADTAVMFERLAGDLRAGAAEYPLVKVICTMSYWNPAWESKLKSRKAK